MAEAMLSGKKRQILDFIEQFLRDRGYPPSVREIGEAVGLTSSSTVHAHLAALQQLGYLRRDPTKPRAIKVLRDAGEAVDDGQVRPVPPLVADAGAGATVDPGRVRHVPLLGDVAAGTNVLAQENIEELLPLPQSFTGRGQVFMLRVRGDSMIDAGIFDGDYVVVSQQPQAENGEIVVAGIPGEEATVKTYRRNGPKVVLQPANERLAPIELDPADVTIFGKVVTVMRWLGAGPRWGGG